MASDLVASVNDGSSFRVCSSSWAASSYRSACMSWRLLPKWAVADEVAHHAGSHQAAAKSSEKANPRNIVKSMVLPRGIGCFLLASASVWAQAPSEEEQ